MLLVKPRRKSFKSHVATNYGVTEQNGGFDKVQLLPHVDSSPGRTHKLFRAHIVGTDAQTVFKWRQAPLVLREGVSIVAPTYLVCNYGRLAWWCALRLFRECSAAYGYRDNSRVIQLVSLSFVSVRDLIWQPDSLLCNGYCGTVTLVTYHYRPRTIKEG